MNNRDKYMENFSLKSLFLYIARQYRWIFLAALAGMIVLSGLNVLKGHNYSDSVKETDVISEEELERSRQELQTVQNNLENAKIRVESQKTLLENHKNSLTEFEEKWEEDIFIQTSADNRQGINTVSQFKGQEEPAVDQTLNAIKAALNSMYDQIAANSGTLGLTSFNVQRLFTVEVNLNQNQISMKTSFETKEGLKVIQEQYHAWMNTKLTEFQTKYPTANLEMSVLEENEYVYYDTDIFNEQRTAADKRISIQNNIANANNAITSAQNDIITNQGKIRELEETIRENEKLWSNTIVLSEDHMVSKSSIIIYLILGAVVGIVFGMVFFAFRYMYGNKLRDADDLRCRTGENVIGTLYSPTYRSGKDKILRKLDSWNGIEEIIDMEGQMRRLALDIRLQLQKLSLSSVILIGTANKEVIEEIGKRLAVLMEDTSCSFYVGNNPVYDIHTAEQLLAADAVVTMEKIGESRIAEIQKLRNYLNDYHIRVLGGITV